MVKQVSKDEPVELVKVHDNFPERITGTVKKFDMQEICGRNDRSQSSKCQAAERASLARFAGGKAVVSRPYRFHSLGIETEKENDE